MPLDDMNKLNRLEELKSKLFNKNYQTKIEHRDVFSNLDKNEVMDSWKTKEKASFGIVENFFMKTSIFKKFFIFSIIFFILTLCYAGYVFFIGGNTVSNNNIDISILGNNFTAGGEELSLVVGIVNRNNSALELVDLTMEYSKSSSEDISVDTEHFRTTLGTIPAGATRNENLKVVLFGEQGTTRLLRITLEYRLAGSNSIFIKEKFYKVNITSTPINLLVDAPSTISPNQDIALNIKTILNATKAISKILVKVDYPFGFIFANSTPAPSFSNNVWDLGDIAPGVENNIIINGKMVDVFDGEEKTFNISSGSQSSTNKSVIDVIFNSIKNTVMVKKPFIEASLFVNGVYQKEYAVDAKTPIRAEIHYSNNLDTKVDDLEIKAKISGNAFNRNTILAQQGYYDSSKDTITWDKNLKDKLKELNPGDSGSVVFSFSPLSLFSTSGGILTNPTININISISGKQSSEGSVVNELNNSSSTSIHIISGVGFSGKALYYSGHFTNTGPIPPKAEQSTTYTITWSLSNTSNSISKAQIKSSIPSWVTFLGPISPTNQDLKYNVSTREITWNIDRIPKGSGITGPSQNVSFQVSFKPSISQINMSPLLINQAVLTGHDDFANVDVMVSKEGIDTRLVNDPAFPVGGGVVVQ